MIEEENQEGLDFVKNFKYSEDYSDQTKNLFIMQVPQILLDELKNKGMMSIISKDKEDVAKLVSNTDTYKIKRFDYPNSYFLTSKQDGGIYDVQATTKSVYQLEKLANKKDALYQFLSQNQVQESFFGGDLNDPLLKDKYGFNVSDLMNDFFMSQKSLLQFCIEINAVNINGKIYFLEMEIFLKIFRELLNQLNNNHDEIQNNNNNQMNNGNNDASSAYSNITIELISYIFPTINIEILQAVLNLFTKQIQHEQNNENEKQNDTNPMRINNENVPPSLRTIEYELTYEKICRFVMLELYLAKKEYYMDDFEEFVEKMLAVYVPECLSNKLSEQEKQIQKCKARNRHFMTYDNNNYSLVQGIDLKKITLVAYDHYQHTFEPKERVALLFEKKKNYFPQEFRDFLEVLNLQKKESDDLVLNSCRAISISIHKKNHPLFSRLYPQENLNTDKLNPDNFSCKVYNYKKK